ncbi:hypothetical protein CHUAL_007819 [Chamberlinius hualienensis]
MSTYLLPTYNRLHYWPENDRKMFENTFPVVVSSLLVDDSRLQQINDRFRKMLDYNVPNGKKQRGILTVIAYKLLAKDPTAQQVFEACIAGWSMELFQASCLVADDIMDNSVLRRGKPCWHLQKNVGLAYAINDAFLLENSAYKLLQDHLTHRNYYTNLIDFIRNIAFRTIYGQVLDLFYTNNQLDMFTTENYKLICDYKTSLYTFYLPIGAAMIMAGHVDVKLFDDVKNILMQIGLLFQMQDDYLDCFGDSTRTGKIGRDIHEGKCTWFVAEAVNLLGKEEMQDLKSCYGKEDPELVKSVINKYRELRLDELYWEQFEDISRSIMNGIRQLSPSSFPKEILHLCLKSLNSKNQLQSILEN